MIPEMYCTPNPVLGLPLLLISYLYCFIIILGSIDLRIVSAISRDAIYTYSINS